MSNRKNVYVGMVGDMLHVGHINIIRHATTLGEVTVGVLTDEAVVGYKRLPFLSFEERAEVVKSIVGVNKVVPQKTLSYVQNLRKLKPDYVVHGDDWKHGDMVSRTRQEVIDTLSEWNGELVEVPYTQGISSTLMNQANDEDRITARYRQSKLRRLLLAKPTIRIIESHSGLSAIIASRARAIDGMTTFDCFWQSSLTDAAHRGKPDCEIVDKSTRYQTVDEIFCCTNLPMIFDGDTGGTIDNVYDLARTLDEKGVSAVCLEDKTRVKRNSLYGSNKIQTQSSIPEYVEKIRAFIAARGNGEVMHISRVESLVYGKSMHEALDRAIAYLDAGSDGVLIHSISDTAREVVAFTEQLRAQGISQPIFVVPTTFPATEFSVFEDCGINGVIYANQLLRAIVNPMSKVAAGILDNGCYNETAAGNFSITSNELLELVPEPSFL